ncbi:MAG: 3-isopropylmalate dehydratase small subunit [Candidatus Omnitrophota bacterium]
MELKGKAHRFGDDVNTDEIIPASFLNISDAQELGKHCMEGITPGFTGKIRQGDIIVAGRNFGCGSSREHAPLSIKACGIACVIAESFARIFYRNAINIGLPILECPEAKHIAQDSILEIDLAKGKIMDLKENKVYLAQSFPEFMLALIDAGGLLPYIRRKKR